VAMLGLGDRGHEKVGLVSNPAPEIGLGFLAR
jgi:hypothetical protein